MYEDIKEHLAFRRGEPYEEKAKWINGLPIGLELAPGIFVSR